MASSMKVANVITEFSFCRICRFNHADLKTHPYSKRHQSSVKKILQRFIAKVDEARTMVSTPKIQETYYEQGVKVWCYFCEAEVLKHRLEDGNSVVCGGLLAHLNSAQHLKKCKMFWWKNKIDSDVLNRYIVKDGDYETFLVNVKKGNKDYKKIRELQLKHVQDVDRILKVESERRELLRKCCNASEPVMNRIIDQPSTSTAALQSSGEKLNIFTGMLPPWLQDDESTNSLTKTIHPNMNDFDRHLKLTKKKRLPAERVGANFDHDGAKPDDWLPSFGRVWNNGRRLATKKQFDAEPRQQKRHCSRNRDDGPALLRAAVAKPPPNLNKYIL